MSEGGSRSSKRSGSAGLYRNRRGEEGADRGESGGERQAGNGADLRKDFRKTWRDWLADLLPIEPTDRPELLEMLKDASERRLFDKEALNIIHGALAVSDMRALPILAQNGWPVVFDATHSVQQPGGHGASSGGQREFVPVLARAAAAIGVAAIFMETHQDPDSAPSDGPNMVPVRALPALLQTLAEIDRLAKENPVRLA